MVKVVWPYVPLETAVLTAEGLLAFSTLFSVDFRQCAQTWNADMRGKMGIENNNEQTRARTMIKLHKRRPGRVMPHHCATVYMQATGYSLRVSASSVPGRGRQERLPRHSCRWERIAMHFGIY